MERRTGIRSREGRLLGHGHRTTRPAGSKEPQETDHVWQDQKDRDTEHSGGMKGSPTISDRFRRQDKMKTGWPEAASERRLTQRNKRVTERR